MGFKKYDGSVWQSINPKKLKGVPYSGTLPAVLAGTKVGYLHRYKVYGNLTQNGTPAPENPIEPSECGERTRNLLNEMEIRNNASINQSTGAVITSTATMLSDYIRVARGQTYIIKAAVSGTLYSANKRPIGLYDEQKIYVGSSALTMVSPAEMVDGFEINIPSTLDSDTNYIRVGMDKAMTNIMLTEGQTALPYEPYGYKLPLLSGSTPVDIYLGESQTTRRIKKLVLTGSNDESWSYNATYNTFSLALSDLKTSGLRKTTLFCSHYMTIDDGRPISNVPNNSIYTDQVISIYILTDAYTTITDFKSYLAQQLTNGTPVTIWYVLAEPETGTLNEPLRKIGDYADTIDSTQTSAQIPTTANSTTISWGGQGLAPSQFASIQEWVDIPTYKRVNGEWVADN